MKLITLNIKSEKYETINLTEDYHTIIISSIGLIKISLFDKKLNQIGVLFGGNRENVKVPHHSGVDSVVIYNEDDNNIEVYVTVNYTMI